MTADVHLAGECPPEVLERVRGTVYYRGIRPEGRGRREGLYFTRHLDEAQFYAGDGGRIVKAEINPKRAVCSRTAVDAAHFLGVLGEYDRLIGNRQFAEADNVVARAARAKGYDSLVRRGGDWVVVVDPEIMTELPGGKTTR